MNHLTRRYFIAGILAMLIIVPLQRVEACLHAGMYAQITFDDAPNNIPASLVAQHFHLTNQVPEFEKWRKPREIFLKDQNVAMKHFRLIGMGASINPWTYWLTSRLPDWLASKPKYIPIFAPMSSCTERGILEGKIGIEVMLVGKTITQTNGEPLFAAASYRASEERWEIYKSGVTSF